MATKKKTAKPQSETVEEPSGWVSDVKTSSAKKPSPSKKPAFTRNKEGDNPHEVAAGCLCDFETAKALSVKLPHKACWFPKSAIHEDSEIQGPGDRGTLVIKQWWVEKHEEEWADDGTGGGEELPGDVECSRETEKAILCNMPDTRECWFPKFALHPASEVMGEGDLGKLVLYKKWAEEHKEEFE